MGVRPDGMHLVETVMQTIDLFDRIELEIRDTVRLVCNDPTLPTDEGNICVRAALALKERFRVAQGVEIRLSKHIPVARGLGGGSSDAAAVLAGLVRLWKLDVELDDLRVLAAELGADVPFFLFGGTCLCRGVGDEVTPLAGAVPKNYLLCIPPVHVSTKRVYKNVKLPLTTDLRTVDYTIEWVCRIGTGLLQKAFFNRLERTALALYPELSAIEELLSKLCNRRWHMSGSGSALYSPGGKALSPQVAETVVNLGCQLVTARTFQRAYRNAKG